MSKVTNNVLDPINVTNNILGQSYKQCISYKQYIRSNKCQSYKQCIRYNKCQKFTNNVVMY